MDNGRIPLAEGKYTAEWSRWDRATDSRSYWRSTGTYQAFIDVKRLRRLQEKARDNKSGKSYVGITTVDRYGRYEVRNTNYAGLAGVAARAKTKRVCTGAVVVVAKESTLEPIKEFSL